MGPFRMPQTNAKWGIQVSDGGVEFTQQILNASNVEKGTTQYSMQSVDIHWLLKIIAPTLKESPRRMAWNSHLI